MDMYTVSSEDATISDVARKYDIPALAIQAANGLESELLRSQLIRTIEQTLHERGYDGVSIDFESIPPQNRDDFTQFLRELNTSLSQRTLQVNVPAKTADEPGNPQSKRCDALVHLF